MAESEIFKECLQKQLDEVDMLQSIYCNSGEFQLQDQFTVLDIKEFITGKSPTLSTKLAYTVNFRDATTTKIEVNVELPHLYPAIESALITVRSGKFTTAQEKSIHHMVEQYIEAECDKTEPYVFQVTSWVQENLAKFCNTPKNDVTSTACYNYERLWIYSHHIKSTTKRRNIVKTARDLDLSGFMRPGKPGIICVEGIQDHVQEFWKTIRQWNWHKIQLRKSETKTSQTPVNFGRFENFREQLFTTTEDGDEGPMDMSLFMKFLEQHNCAYIKEYIFGF